MLLMLAVRFVIICVVLLAIVVIIYLSLSLLVAVLCPRRDGGQTPPVIQQFAKHGVRPRL